MSQVAQLTEIQRSMLQRRVDLVNEIYSLAGAERVTLKVEAGFTVYLPASVFGETFQCYGMEVGLEAFLEGLILGASRNNPAARARLEQVLEEEGE